MPAHGDGRLLLWVVLAGALLLLGPGCGGGPLVPEPDPAGDQDLTGPPPRPDGFAEQPGRAFVEYPASAPPPDGLCGSRTVSAPPGAGSWQRTVRLTVAMSPPDSALGRALALFNPAALNSCEPFRERVEQVVVDAAGTIAGTGQTLVVASGCLTRTSDPGHLPDAAAIAVPTATLSGMIEVQAGDCAAGELPLGPDGIGDTSPGHICLAVETATCLDCSAGDEAWRTTTRSTAAYRALGSIRGVQVSDPCTFESQIVDIAAGEQVVIEMNYEEWTLVQN